MTDVLAYAVVALPLYALVVWANQFFALRLDLPRRSSWAFLGWLLICAGVPAGAGLLAAWAVS